MDLGPVEDPAPAFRPRAGVINSASKGWTNGIVPYVLNPDIPNPQRILDGMAIVNSATPVRFVPRTNEANYVHVVRLNNFGSCSSAVGMSGGEQFLNVDDTCSANGMVHELGHTLGLF